MYYLVLITMWADVDDVRVYATVDDMQEANHYLTRARERCVTIGQSSDADVDKSNMFHDARIVEARDTE